MSEPPFGENQRLNLVVHHALQDVHTQMKKLKKKDRKALQSEFFEWNTSELEDLDITYYDHFSYW